MIKKSPLAFCGIIFALIGGVFSVSGLALLPIFMAELGFPLMTLIFLPVGLLFLGLGICFITLPKAMRKRRLALIGGKLVYAKLNGVIYKSNISVNGRCPQVILAQYLDPDTNTMRVCESEPFWYDPEPFLEDVSELPVWVDPKNPKRYWMDLRSLSLPEQG